MLWVGPVVGAVGVVILVATVVLGWIVVPNIIDDKIIEEVRLVNGTDTWDKWQDIPVPVYLKFYVYNITNPDDVENGIKPVFTEKGPYSYRETRVKVNISQDNGPNFVRYQQPITYFFDEEHSCKTCYENDTVNIINIAFLSVVRVIHAESPLLAAIIANFILPNETLVRRGVEVGDLTFKGFDTSAYSNSLIGGLLPEEFDGGRFGLYKGQNGTLPPEDIYEIYTGVGNHADFGRIKTWADSEAVPDSWWQPGSPCAAINGTDGSLFPPFVEKDWVMYVFSTDLCRSLYLTYEKEVEHMGIKGYRFVAPRKMLEDPRTNVDNQCFCVEEDIPGGCTYSGVIHIKGCKSGAPIMMSTPHFLDGEENYLKASNLPPPVKEVHETVIDIEPNTGLTLAANKRIQVNVEVLAIRNITALKNIKQCEDPLKPCTDFPEVFPLLWADEEARLDQENADDLKGRLLTPLKIIGIVKWVLLGVGLVVMVAGVGIFMLQRRRARETV